MYSVMKTVRFCLAVLAVLLAPALQFEARAAGATIKAADLVVVGFNSDNVATSTRAFALMALDDIPVGSVIFITDRGIYSSTTPPTFTDANGDGTVKLTVSTQIPKGTVMHFLNNVGTSPYVAFNGTSYGTFSTLDTTAKRFNLSLDGDQILIYQTSDDTPTGTIQRLASGGGTEGAFIYAFNEDQNAGLGAVNDVDGWWLNPASVSQVNASTQSRLPAGSTAVNSSDGTGNAGTADAFGRLGSSSASVEYEDWAYTGPTSSTSKSGWLRRIHTVANWTGNDTGVTFMSAGAYTVAAPPAVVSLVSSSTLNGSYNQGDTISVTVTFDTAVTVTGTPRVQLNSGGSVFATYSGGSGTATLTFDYTVGAGENASRLDYSSTTALTLNGGTISSAGGNATLTLPSPGADGSLAANKVIVIDTDAPSVFIDSPSSSITASGPVSFTITYGGADMVSLTAGNVTLNSTGSASGTVAVTGSGTSSRTVTISGITGDGTLGISIAAGTASDTAGNTAAAAGPGSVFTVDNTPPPAPVITGISQDTGSSSGDGITSDTTLVISGTAEAGSTVDLALVGTGVIGSPVADGGGGWSFDYTGTVLGQGAHTFTATATDVSGNTGPASGGFDVTVDTAAPEISIGSPSASASSGSDITFTITYTDANAVTLSDGDITLNTTGDASGTATVTGSGSSSRTVTISGITGNGTIGVSIAAATATDTAGNSASAAGPGSTFTVDTSNDAPTVAGALAGQAVDDDSTIMPFAGVTISDSDAPAQTLSVSISIDVAAKGAFTTLGGFSDEGGGLYAFSGTASEATAAVRAMVFTPASNRVPVGDTETATFSIAIDDGNGGNGGDNTTTVVSTSVNDAPSVVGNTLFRPPGRDAKISIAELLSNDTDADGDSLTVSLPGSTSTNGASVSISGGWVVYRAAPDNSDDSFEYAVSDGNGGSVTGTVTVTTRDNSSQSANILSTGMDGADVIITFQTIPNTSCKVQYSASLAPPTWIDLADVTSSPLGAVEYRDVNPPGGSRFYRTFIP